MSDVYAYFSKHTKTVDGTIHFVKAAETLARKAETHGVPVLFVLDQEKNIVFRTAIGEESVLVVQEAQNIIDTILSASNP